MSILEKEPVLEADDIQGNGLRGFDTNHLQLLGFKIDRPDLARPWLANFSRRLASLSQVHQYRLRRSNGEPSANTEVLVNAALSRFGLDALGFDGTAVGDGFFNISMGRLAGSLGDRVVDGLAVDYVIGQDRARTPDVLLLVGCQDNDTLNKTSAIWRTESEAAGLRMIYEERGHVLPGETEHFGYRDGISQPGSRGLLPGDPPQPLTLRLLDPADPEAAFYGKPGQPLVWPGQFVFGYESQTEDPALPGPKVVGTDWMHNGSLLVFRRLRQDVHAFRNFLEEKAQEVSASLGRSVSARQLGAGVVGRWEDGTPVTLSAERENADISGDALGVNHFAYGGITDVRVGHDKETARVIPGHPSDEAGLRCPLFAHVRKVNPRNLRTDQGGASRTLTFQMLRRGIPYGLLYEAGQEEADRGLLFFAYQTSFAKQFKVLNNLWMNNPAAPERDEEGHDLLVGQNETGGTRFGSLRDELGNELARLQTISRWVTPTGGAFLFAPSLSFFHRLST